MSKSVVGTSQMFTARHPFIRYAAGIRCEHPLVQSGEMLDEVEKAIGSLE